MNLPDILHELAEHGPHPLIVLALAAAVFIVLLLISRLVPRSSAPDKSKDHAAYVERMAAVVTGFRRRAETLENERDYARGEIAELKSDLAGVQHELAKSQHDLKVAEEENARLWLLAERDRARIVSETAGHNRDRAENETPKPTEE